jgi:hypothetical protein
MPVNAAGAPSYTLEYKNAGAERRATIIAARTLGISGNVLRAVVDRIRVCRVSGHTRYWNIKVGTAAERFVIRACGQSATLPWQKCLSVIIGESQEAVTLTTQEVYRKYPA